MARVLNVLKARGGSLVPPAVQRGYHIVYRDHETNHCPGCGRSHWYVGRFSAECGFCATALPLVEGLTKGAGLFRIGHNRSLDGDFAIAA